MTMQKKIPLVEIPQVIQTSIIPMMNYEAYEITNIQNEEAIEKTFAPQGDGDKELYFLINSRGTKTAGWVFMYKGKTYTALFSRTANMYIGKEFLNTEDISTNLLTVDVMSASRILWPHKGYTTGGKVSALRGNKDYQNMNIKKLYFDKKQIAQELDTKTQELAYMTVGLLDYGEVEEWFFKILENDEFVILVEADEAIKRKEEFDLTAKADIFFDLLKEYLEKTKS